MRDLLQIVNAKAGILAHELKGVVAVRAAFRIAGIKEKYLLAVFGPIAACQPEVLPFDVVSDRGIRPMQKVRNDNPDPVAGPGRGETHQMLPSGNAQKTASP